MKQYKPKILFVVYDNDSHIHFFPMGLAALTAYCLKRSFEVCIYNQDLNHFPEQHLTDYLNSNYFDIVGLSFIGAYYPYRKAKAISIAINNAIQRPFYVIGGHGPSPEPDYFLKKLRADAVVIGEGEESFVDLVNAVMTGSSLAEVKGIAYRSDDQVVVNPPRTVICDINNLPMPAYDSFPIEYYRLRKDSAHIGSVGNRFSMPLLSGRGCKFKCNFCYRIDEGMRLRSADAIIEEMKYLNHKWNISHFMFYDDLLMESTHRTIELCESFINYGPKNMTFICQGRLNYATPEVLDVMGRSGCVYIYYGIESFNDDMLRVMKKALNTDMIIRGVENTINAGISFSPNMIFGNIGETREHLQNSLEFLLKYDDCALLRAIKPVTPYPGSPLYNYAIEKGMLKDARDFYEYKHINTDLLTVNFTHMSDDDYYAALFSANSQIVDNYCTKSIDRQRKQLTRLYFEKDATFRGFRHI